MPDTAFVHGDQKTGTHARVVKNEATVRETHRGWQMRETSGVTPENDRHRNIMAASRDPFTHAGEGMERASESYENKGDFISGCFRVSQNAQFSTS